MPVVVVPVAVEAASMAEGREAVRAAIDRAARRWTGAWSVGDALDCWETGDVNDPLPREVRTA